MKNEEHSFCTKQNIDFCEDNKKYQSTVKIQTKAVTSLLSCPVLRNNWNKLLSQERIYLSTAQTV